MKLLTVLLAQSVRLTRPVSGTWGYLVDVRQAIAEEYLFKGVPTDADLVAAASKLENVNSPASVLTFTEGKKELNGRAIAIEQFQIYAGGFILATKTHTKDCDHLLEGFVTWASGKFNLEFQDMRAGSAHSSQIDFCFERPLPELLPIISGVGPRITDRLSNFFEYRPSFELTSVNFWFDKMKFPAFAPAALRIDRRAEVPYEQNVYWSDAPLATDDHIAVLTEFEETCLKTLR